MSRIVNIILMSQIDNDSRVKKEIKSMLKHNLEIRLFSMNSNELIPNCENYIIKHSVKRMIFPGISFLTMYMKFILSVLLNGRKTDYVHCNDLITLPIGVIQKLLSFGRVNLVYDAHEFESNVKPNQSEASIRLTQYIEGFLLKFPDHIITVSAGIADEYVRIYKIKKPAVVLNCPPYIEVSQHNYFRNNLGIRDDQIIFLYQGALSRGRGIQNLLNAFSGLDSKFVIVFMGYGNLKQLVIDEAEKRDNIFFHQAVSTDVLIDYTSSADFGVSLIENLCKSNYLCLPNKLFEYLMAGLPVIVSNLPEMKKIIDTYAVGIVANENSVDGIRSAVIEASKLDILSLKSKISSCRSVYNWQEQEKILDKIYY